MQSHDLMETEIDSETPGGLCGCARRSVMLFVGQML